MGDITPSLDPVSNNFHTHTDNGILHSYSAIGVHGTLQGVKHRTGPYSEKLTVNG